MFAQVIDKYLNPIHKYLPIENFNPSQPRDGNGRWSGGSNGGGTAIGYRGQGTGSDEETGMTWYSETPELAQKYADFRGGTVVSKEITIVTPYEVNNPKQSLAASSFFSQATQQTDISKLDKAEVMKQRKAFLDHFGESSREMVDYWSNREAKVKTKNLLKSLGYDSVLMKERGFQTVAVFSD